MQSLTHLFPPVHRDGHGPVLVAALSSLFLLYAWTTLGVVALAATVLLLFAFRDPERVAPLRPGVVVSPSDGRIRSVDHAVPPPSLGLPPVAVPHIAIDIGLLDVHVSRAPLAGTVARSVYLPPGVEAERDGAGARREHHGYTIDAGALGALGLLVCPGFLGHRLETAIGEGEAVATGGRLGILRYASRVELFLPEGADIRVVAGQRAVSGETLLADLWPAPARIDQGGTP